MVQSGNPNIPGVVTDITTADSATVEQDAPSDVGIIGQYDPTTGTADPDTVYAITRTVDAETRFGDNSPLTTAVIDSLREGAAPVYALTARRNTVSGEDIAAAGDSGSLVNAPVTEVADKVTFTVDSTAKATVITFETPDPANVPDGEAHYNPVTGEYALDAVPASTATVDYEHFDYTSAIDAFMADVDAASTVDLLGCTSENDAVVQYLQSEVKAAAKRKDRMIAFAGAGVHVHTDSYSNPYDTSRLQLVYPPRTPEYDTAIGSYVGRRARMGIEASPLNKRLTQHTTLSERLSEGQQTALLEQNVVPLISESRGVRIGGDPTCVADTNNEEAGMDYSFGRLVMDYVADVIEDAEEPYIGKFHNPRVRGDLQNRLNDKVERIQDSEVIQSYSIVVSAIDAMNAQVDVNVTPVRPLTNIFNSLTAGSE